MKTSRKKVVKKNGLFISLILFVVFISGLLILFFKSTKNYLGNQRDLYWVKTDSEDLICWGNNDCVWSWKNHSQFDSTLITEWGVLKKNLPQKISSRVKLLTINQNSQYSPIDGFYSNDQYLIFSISDNKKSTVYLFSKTNKQIKELFSDNSRVWLAKIRSDNQVALFGKKIKSENQYFVVNLENSRKGMPITFDTFEWSSNSFPDHYRVGIINSCDSKKVETYNCPIYGDLISCPNYPQIPNSYLKSYQRLFITQDYFLDLPKKWDRSVYQKEIFNLDNNSIFVEYKKSCSSDIGNIYPQSWIRKFKIDLSDARLVQFVNPKASDNNEGGLKYLLAIAEVNYDSQYYQYYLYTDDPNNSKNNQFVKEITEMLKTIKFIKNFK